MLELDSCSKTKEGSEKGFGIFFSLVFFMVGLYPLVNGESVYLWAFVVSAILIFISYFFSNLLFIPNKIWIKMGMILGVIVAPIVIAFIYFITIVPTGIFMKITGRDLLSLKMDKNIKSYWVNRTQSIGSMKDQF